MFIRHKKKIIIFGLAAFAIVVSAIVAGRMSESFETFAAGTYTAYDFQDWIYYDPVTGSSDCGVDNYWTFYNTDTTCYRFFMAERNDNSSKSTVSLILDHNAGYGPFSNINTILSDTGTTWRDYAGQLSLITENELMTLLTIQELPSIAKDSSGSIYTIDRDGKYYRYASNTESFIDGNLQNGHGYWTSTTREFDGTTYAYTLTEAGWNRLVNVAENRGIRPVITLDKSKIAGSSHGVTDITSLVQNSQKYQYSPKVYNGTTFQQLQGFTVTDGDFKNSGSDNLIFYSSNSSPLYASSGFIFGYTGPGFTNALYGPGNVNPYYSVGTGHGNDMTYNTKNKKVYILGGDGKDDPRCQLASCIWEYSGTSAPTVAKQNSTSSIGYREPNTSSGTNAQDMYFVNADFRTYLTDGSFNNKYMLDATTDEIGQGFEYHNGYLYYATSTINIPCAADYHHCGSFNSMSGVVDVYNVKLNSDGAPSKNFGKRVERFYTDGDNLKMELESISFRDGKAYLGYSAQGVDSSNPFKFYSFDYSNIAIKLNVAESYQDASDSTTVTISSGDQLQPISGYTMSADGYSMSKTVNAATISDNLNVCDYYDNCTTVNISHTNPYYDPTKPVQTVTFASSSVSKAYGDANFTNVATTSGDGNITYASSNTAVASVNAASGEVTIHSAGSATITATAAATSAYAEGTASYPLTVAKATSARPSELDIVFAGVAGEPLSTISFATPGLSWVDSATLISVGINTYPVYYTQNNDSTNYTTETFTAAVNTSKLAQTVTFASSCVDKTYGDANFTNAATTSGDGNITYTSSNTAVASVDATSGEVTIHSAGSATITATAAATSTYAEGIAYYPLTVAKATSTRPSELDIVFTGIAGEPLSTISFATLGIVWENGSTVIAIGNNEYPVYYTQNNDTANYTTESFMATVNGLQRRYEVVGGDGQTYTIGESKVASFKINADFSLFEAGGEVYVDDELLAEEYYQAEAGSTVINIRNDYLESLPLGEHNIIVYFGDGGEATARFTLTESDPVVVPDTDEGNEESQDTEEKTRESGAATSDTKNQTSVPNTGGNTENESSGGPDILSILPIVLVIASVLIYTKISTKRHRKSD